MKNLKGNTKAFSFPIGLKNSKDGRLSFSGVKSSLRRLIETHPELVNEAESLKRYLRKLSRSDCRGDQIKNKRSS